VSPFTAGKVLVCGEKKNSFNYAMGSYSKNNMVHNDEVSKLQFKLINCLLLHTQQWLYYFVLEKKV